MRTAHEIHLAEGQSLVAQTDLEGKITHVNPAFVDISGYALAELVGQPTSIVRHPDVPQEVHDDLWQSVRRGDPWTGVLKNRCKDGSWYWSRINVTPMRERGRSIGYMSVRVAPAPEEVAAATAAYAQIRKGGPRRLRVVGGSFVQPGLAGLLAKLRHSSLAMRIWFCTSAVNTLLLGIFVANFATLNLSTWLGASVFIATALGLVLNVFLWYTLRSHVIAPLKAAVHGARAIAAGDLSTRFAGGGNDEMGQLLRALQQMNSNLLAIIGDVRSNVTSMAGTTGAIAAGNADLARRTAQQAASLEQTASSMEQFASTVKQNADNAVRANALAATASQVAADGGVIVADVVATMNDISASARRVTDIVGLIDGIAFQTNLLALNAAVEAARAGEQGRGFAVVAGEVHNLARRSSTAAQEIKALIDDSIGKIDIGLDQVTRAGATMAQMVGSVQQVTSLMHEISNASREQSEGISHVNQAVSHLDEVTRQNAALVEEAAASAAHLDHEAAGLAQAVSIFRTGAQRPSLRLASR